MQGARGRQDWVMHAALHGLTVQRLSPCHSGHWSRVEELKRSCGYLLSVIRKRPRARQSQTHGERWLVLLSLGLFYDTQTYQMMPKSIPTPIITASDGGTTWNLLGEKIICKVASNQTESAYAVVEEISPPQAGPPLHLHRTTDEIFYVLEGEYQVVCGSRTFSAPEGTLFVAPKSVPHSLRNISAGTAEFSSP